jgi:hypothetical protein
MISSIFKDITLCSPLKASELVTCAMFVPCLAYSSAIRSRWNVLLKRHSIFNGLYRVISQKREPFSRYICVTTLLVTVYVSLKVAVLGPVFSPFLYIHTYIYTVYVSICIVCTLFCIVPFMYSLISLTVAIAQCKNYWHRVNTKLLYNNNNDNNNTVLNVST